MSWLNKYLFHAGMYCLLVLVAGMPMADGQAAGRAGLLQHKIRLDQPITLSAGKPLAAAEFVLEAGKYYSLKLISDGSAEVSLVGPEFFRNVWVNEIVINDIEVRPLGVDSVEFDDEGEMTMTFVTIRPGTFYLKIRGTTAQSQRATFIVK